jgi:hypothetical protein
LNRCDKYNHRVAAGLCIPAAGALAGIHTSAIDYARARSARDREKPREAVRLREVFKSRPLLIFIVVLVLFQLADASMMPLASGRLGHEHNEQSELITASLVAIPEVVTVLIASWIARQANDWGRTPLLILGFCILPVRAVLFALAPGPWYLLGRAERIARAAGSDLPRGLHCRARRQGRQEELGSRTGLV